MHDIIKLIIVGRIIFFMAFNNNGSVSKQARKLAKAVKHAKHSGVFDAAGKGEPVRLRAKRTDGLEDEFVRVFIERGFDIVKLDMSKMTDNGFDDATNQLGTDLMVTVIAFNVNRNDDRLNRRLFELLHARHDAAVKAGFDKPHAMSLVIVSDETVPDGVAFDAIQDENIDSMLAF